MTLTITGIDILGWIATGIILVSMVKVFGNGFTNALDLLALRLHKWCMRDREQEAAQTRKVAQGWTRTLERNPDPYPDFPPRGPVDTV